MLAKSIPDLFQGLHPTRLASDLQTEGPHPHRLCADGPGQRCQIMDSNLQASQKTHPPSHPPFPGSHPRPCRKPAGRKPLKGIDAPLTAQTFLMVLRAVFPKLNAWLNALPDPRVQDWNLTLEKEIMANTVARAGYFGNHSTRLEQLYQFNAATPMKVPPRYLAR